MGKSYAQIINEKVVNILVLDDPADNPVGGMLVPLENHNDVTWGIGWGYKNGRPVPPTAQALPVDENSDETPAISSEGLRASILAANTLEELKLALLGQQPEQTASESSKIDP